MNFQHLKYFLMVAEELNITRAAERLYISQQSLSNHIGNLERELDVKLFTRSPKLSLTYAGGLLVDTASQILDLHSQYLTKVGLCANDYLGREVDASLSGGEVKRIEIASILARNAKLMIFDEPEAGIDLWSFARLTETFEQLHAAGGATMIIISHQERIISLADEVIVVGDGQLRHRGTPAEILPQILADTLGACPVLTKEAMA